MKRVAQTRLGAGRRAWVGLGLPVLVAMTLVGCSGSSPSQSPTPDPFVGLADRSDQAFREGLEAYAIGAYRDALTAFERARTLSPADDPKIEQMIERSRAAMEPTPTPVPPTATAVPVPPTPTPMLMSAVQPDAELGLRYFGQVMLTVVPGQADVTPLPATQFFYQDQIALRLEGLNKHLRLPFTLRVFNVDTNRLVASVRSDELASDTSAQAALGSKSPVPTATSVPVRSIFEPPASPTPASEANAVHFFENYVWYHQGGEEPGRYRVELFANGTLTHAFDYTVGTVPVAPPVAAAPAPALDEEQSLPTAEPELPPAPAPVVPEVPIKLPPVAPVSPPAEPTAPPPPTAIPSPTPSPTPSTALTTIVGGLPAGIDINTSTGRVFIADGSGVIWTTSAQGATLKQPFNLDHLPVDLGIDQTTGRVYVSARNDPSLLILDGQTGARLSTIALPVTPGDIRVDSDLGLLYVTLPEKQALGVIDVRAGRFIRTVDGLPQITSLALDPVRHMLYVGHLAGQVSVIDAASSKVIARTTVTGPGLSSVGTARGLAFAINTASHEFAVLDPLSQAVTRYRLGVEPAAVAAGEDSGSVYILASKPYAILRLDPTDGTEIGRITLPDRSGRFGVRASDPRDFQGLRSRMVLNRADETIYVTLPEAGTLSVASTDLFPEMAYEIPQPDLGDSTASTIPGVLRPAATPLPAVPAPYVQVHNPTPSQPEEGSS